MSKRQKFTPEFRAEAVELVISSQKSLIEVAASLGINEGTLGNWVRAYRAEHPEAETSEDPPYRTGPHRVRGIQPGRWRRPIGGSVA